MTTKTFPEYTITTCDACGVDCTAQNRRASGALILKRDTLDFSGHPVADGSMRLDLCDRCLATIALDIQAAREMLRRDFGGAS